MDAITRIAIGIGSNLGDRLNYLKQGASLLATRRVLTNLLCSQVYESPPWGYAEQPHFLNAVVVGDTNISALQLMRTLREIETDIGRTPTFQNGPREIDLDLLAYGDVVMNNDTIRIPHPGIAERDFVLLPLFEVWPNWKHPVLQKTVAELMIKLDSDRRLQKNSPLSAKVVVNAPLSTMNL